MLQEEIYTLCINFPNLKGETLRKIVENELHFYFKEKNDILFDYSLLKKHRKEIILLLSCINTNKGNILEKYIKPAKSIAILPIQILFINYIKKLKLNKDCILIFQYASCIYVIGCSEYKPLACNVLKKDNRNKENVLSAVSNIEDIYESNFSAFDINFPKNIYFINLMMPDIIEEFYGDKWQCLDLGNMKEDIINFYE